MLSVLRLLTFAEISRRILREYPTVFAAGSWILTGAAAVLLSCTAYPARDVRAYLAPHRDWRSAACAYAGGAGLGVPDNRGLLSNPDSASYRLILIGIGTYSSLQIVNYELLLRQLIAPYSIPDYVRRASMIVSRVIWTYAVWRWSGVPDSQPKLISQIAYDRLSPQIHGKMQELNDRLGNLVGKAQ